MTTEAQLKKMIIELGNATFELFDADPMVFCAAVIDYLNRVDPDNEYTLSDITLPAIKSWEVLKDK